MHRIGIILLLLLLISCQKEQKAKPQLVQKETTQEYLKLSENILNYKGTPRHAKDKNMLMFSDQGAWFAYSIPDSIASYGGFSGAFLMTQENGIWSSTALARLQLYKAGVLQEWKPKQNKSYTSHLEQVYVQDDYKVKQQLVFISGHTALMQTEIVNTGEKTLELEAEWKGSLLAKTLKYEAKENIVNIQSEKSTASGYLQFEKGTQVILGEDGYVTTKETITVKPKEVKKIVLSQTFIFSEYDWKKEQSNIEQATFEDVLRKRKEEKNGEIQKLIAQKRKTFTDKVYDEVLAKTILTLQNNWRIPAGEIKHEGMFPSYHYKWFHGFWSWDTWKQAVGVAKYDPELAKKQMRLMFEFQDEDGFVADVVYRDTTIEKHNYRDTKPPLSAWAVHKIFQADGDKQFVEEMYPKLKKYHYWWYNKRDHDKDGLCEYGSTDGSLIAAKWESGMDNAIRFDQSKILKNEEGAYSLDQESVDLNAYLYAEKKYLAQLANIIQNKDTTAYQEEAIILKEKIQQQFYDPKDGWFYDTNLSGKQFIKGEGSEGWTALWAKVATTEQAEAVHIKMMDTSKFYTRVPFQTMTADHEKFNPLKGYWRGPNWLDQAYFGVKALRNYNYHEDANRATIAILSGAQGILEKGKAIRENYHPLTGEGLNAHNFSWSAAHIIMLLLEEAE